MSDLRPERVGWRPPVVGGGWWVVGAGLGGGGSPFFHPPIPRFLPGFRWLAGFLAAHAFD